MFCGGQPCDATFWGWPTQTCDPCRTLLVFDLFHLQHFSERWFYESAIDHTSLKSVLFIVWCAPCLPYQLHHHLIWSPEKCLGVSEASRFEKALVDMCSLPFTFILKLEVFVSVSAKLCQMVFAEIKGQGKSYVNSLCYVPFLRWCWRILCSWCSRVSLVIHNGCFWF